MPTLYFGDNLNILRDKISPESIDLIYLDPPFNSKRNYNLLFRTPKGHESDAQITAFEDSWQWGDQAEKEFDEILKQPNTNVAEMVRALRQFLKTQNGQDSDIMAYLVMMANRLLEMYRVLRPTGSLYLHCDPTASHYLKVVMDSIFGAENFRNEIIWQRTSSHNDSKKWASVHDTILFYSKSSSFIWNRIFTEHDKKYVDTFYRHSDDRGIYRLDHIIRSATMGPRPNLSYEFKGYKPEWGWRVVREKLEALDADNRIEWSSTGRPYLKRYLEEQSGTPIKSVVTDILPISAQAAERLGYPTQKPLALLERIISASSPVGGVVCDPFCGCGTAVHAAQKLGRDWIGIDITHLAIRLIEKRLREAFPDLKFNIEGTPRDIDGARELAFRDKFQFQFWACALVGAQPYRGGKRGADSGIDGVIFFQDDVGAAKKAIVSVKGGEHVTRTMVADLKNTVEREKARIGFFVTLAPPTQPMTSEAISAGFYESPHSGAFPKIQILTVDGLVNGTEFPKYPDMSRGGLTFKKTKTENRDGTQGKLF